MPSSASWLRRPCPRATRRSYRFDLEPFADVARQARQPPLDDVDARALADYAAELGRDRRKLAPATISRKLAAIRSFLRHALGAVARARGIVRAAAGAATAEHAA